MPTRYDAIIIGGGHNGLVCGSYLAKAGLKVLVLERRPVFGGAAVTEEFTPGFRTSTFSYDSSRLAAAEAHRMTLDAMDRLQGVRQGRGCNGGSFPLL